jgi:hypothetical protein
MCTNCLMVEKVPQSPFNDPTREFNVLVITSRLIQMNTFEIQFLQYIVQKNIDECFVVSFING